MNYLTAQKARDLTNLNLTLVQKAQQEQNKNIDSILIKVRKAAEAGKNSIELRGFYHNDDLSRVQIKKLTNLGFTVYSTTYQYRNKNKFFNRYSIGSYYVVSWKEYP